MAAGPPPGRAPPRRGRRGDLRLWRPRGEPVRAAPGDAAAATGALRWNRLADDCFPPDQRPRLLSRQRSELAALVPGEPAPAVPPDGPPTPLDLYHDGLELAAQARYSEALTNLRAFTEQQPTHVMGWFVRGVCHAGVVQLPDA